MYLCRQIFSETTGNEPFFNKFQFTLDLYDLEDLEDQEAILEGAKVHQNWRISQLCYMPTIFCVFTLVGRFQYSCCSLVSRVSSFLMLVLSS